MRACVCECIDGETIRVRVSLPSPRVSAHSPTRIHTRTPCSPGRFDRLLYVPLPDRAARMQIVQQSLKKVPLDTNVAGDLGV